MTTSGPIIVTGADRTGTTLLYALLGSHPAVSMVRRTNLWRWFDQRHGDLADPDNLDRCLDAMLLYRRLQVVEPDRAALRAAFVAGAPTYGRLFDLLHRQHADRHGRRRWADKSLHTEHHAQRVFAELPDARIIHMVRDPRDRYASILRRYDGRSKGLGAATGRWLASVRRGRRNLRQYPDRYLLVRYETLAVAPEPTLRSICAFIGEDYDAGMLRMDGVVGDSDRDGNSSFGSIAPGTISTGSIGRYGSILTPRQIAFIQASAGRMMRAHDYTPQPVRLSARDRAVFYLAALPWGTARLIGWTASQALGERRDGGVPEHRLTSPAAT